MSGIWWAVGGFAAGVAATMLLAGIAGVIEDARKYWQQREEEPEDQP